MESEREQKLLIKLANAFKKSSCFIIMAVLTAVATTVNYVVPYYGFINDGFTSSYGFSNPTSIVENGDDYVVVDDSSSVFCFDENGITSFIIPVTPDKKAKFGEVMAADDGGIYLHYTKYADDAYVTEYEAVLKYDSSGKFEKEVCRYDYTNDPSQPHRTERLTAFSCNDGENISFVYKENDKVSYITLNAKTGMSRVKGEISEKGIGEKYVDFAPGSDGTVLYIAQNGEIGRLEAEGKKTPFYTCGFSIADGGYIPQAVAEAGGKVFFLESEYSTIYDITDGKPETFLNGLDIFSDEELNEDEYNYISGVFSDGEKLFGGAGSCIWAEAPDEDGITVIGKNGMTLPLGYTVANTAKSVCAVIMFPLWGLCILWIVGALMKWRLVLLGKQLLLIIPVVGILVFIVFFSMMGDMQTMVDEDVSRQLITMNEMSIERFDGDKIKTIDSLADIGSEEYNEVRAIQDEILSGNDDVWNKTFSNIMYIPSGSILYNISSSYNSSQPFLEPISFGGEDWLETMGEYYEPDSNTFVCSLEGVSSKELAAQTPIFDSQGNLAAVFQTTVDLATYEDQLHSIRMEILRLVAMLFPLLIAGLWLITSLTIRHLKKAGAAVEKIAGGDFNAKITGIPNDEVGDICKGVNAMSDNLLKSFTEIEQMRDIYFKFVPIQFMQLLKKKHISEIQLGDGLSMDLTVLFCDIRSFSLNSEMMTAADNFSFVNKVYGAAGPIIRKYDGFIDKYIGDAVMALFTDAQNAVAAGVELYRYMVTESNGAVTIGEDNINVGVGVHSGMAMVGIVGEDQRLAGTVISNTVNLTSRLESLTKQYNTGMIISKDTLDRMGDTTSLNMRFLGMIQVAGVNEVKGLYEVLDCLDDKRRNARTETKHLFESAVKQFHLGNFDVSVEKFEKVHEIDPDDKAVTMYIHTVKEKIANGSTESNVFRFSRK